MSYFFKWQIAQAISTCCKPKSALSIEKIISNILFKTKTKPDTPIIQFRYYFKDHNLSELDDLQQFRSEIIDDVEITEKIIHFSVNKNKFLNYVLTQDLTCSTYMSLTKPSKHVVDFSSPNIAKPFHYGHLRSTIIGNFISNISEYLKHNVIRINYLGDWGVQFGLLKCGLDKFVISQEKLAENPLQTLYKIYVSINQLAEEDPSINDQARKIFHDMEFAVDENEDLKKWLEIRKYTINEISRAYLRLGIKFDEYHWESDYSAKKIQSFVDELVKKNILIKEDDALVAKINDISIPFLKKDGTTLYLSRDLAAVLDRYRRFKFDRMLYVVDNSQAKHFSSLINLTRRIDAECAQKIEHVEFGRVLGLSTRKGTASFLDDILNELREQMELKRIESVMTRGTIGGEIADILGISSLIVNDFKRKRTSNYKFVWEEALKTEGYTGIKMQYCHSRIFSLERNCGVNLPNECDLDVLNESEAINLLMLISRFEDVIVHSYTTLEPNNLVKYLFDLCDGINKAHQALKVKGIVTHIAEQRLLLFHKAKTALNNGMKILGIKPLNEM